MRRLWVLIGLIVVVIAAGVVISISAGYGGLDKRPWLPIGIVLIGFGAVGALIMTTVGALRQEARQARVSRRARQRDSS